MACSRVGSALVVCLVVVSIARAQQGGQITTEAFRNGQPVPVANPKITRPEGQAPTILYAPSRASTGWLELPGNRRVAIDGGVAWQGRSAYLSLTGDLIVVDAATNKVLWFTAVSAVWDTITFENMARPGEKPAWSLILKSSTQAQFQQLYDLETGAKGELRGGPEQLKGSPVQPRQVWAGSEGVRKESLYVLVDSAAQWNQLRAEVFGPMAQKPPTSQDIDFTKELLLVCYGGETSNWNGIRLNAGAAGPQGTVLRLQRLTYQSMGSSPVEHPFGVFVLPRDLKRPIVLEYNMQRLIGGPEIWREFRRLGESP